MLPHLARSDPPDAAEWSDPRADWAEPRLRLPLPERQRTILLLRDDEGLAYAEIAEGLRWLWHHGPIRTLTLTVVSFTPERPQIASLYSQLARRA